MATQENKIRFTIGSVFNGEGFAKANNAVKDVGKEVKSAKRAIGPIFFELSKSAEGLGGSMGKLGASVTSVGSAFATMGIAGGAMVAIGESTNWLVAKFKELEEEFDSIEKEISDAIDAANHWSLRERAEEAARAMSYLKNVSLANQKAFDSMTAAAVKMADAVAKTVDAKGASTISEMLIGNFNEAMKAESESLKALVAAQGNAAVAQVKETQERERQAAKIQASQDAYDASLKAVALSADSVTNAADALRKSEKEVKVALDHWGSMSTEYAEAARDREKAASALASAERDLADRQSASAVAAKNLEAAQAQGAAAINAASLASQQAKAAAEEAAKADRIAALKTEQKAVAIAGLEETVLAYRMQLATAKEGSAKHLEITKKLEAAESALEDARIAAASEEDAQRLTLKRLERANAALAEKREKAKELEGELTALEEKRKETVNAQERNLQFVQDVHAAQQAINAGLSTGMATDQAVHRGISGQGYTYQVGANGTPDNFIDFQRAQRYGERAERNAANAAARNDSSARKYDRLLDDAIAGKKISDRDQKFMDDYESFMDSQRTESEWQQAIDDLKGAHKKTLSDLDKQIEDVKNKLEELGLK
jgi:hypothetical protein